MLKVEPRLSHTLRLNVGGGHVFVWQAVIQPSPPPPQSDTTFLLVPIGKAPLWTKLPSDGRVCAEFAGGGLGLGLVCDLGHDDSRNAIT